MADISRLVSVSTRITAPGGTAQPGFGQVLMVTEESFNVLAGQSDRVRTFRDLSAVGDSFDTTSEAYQGAAVYFAQSPYPRPLRIAKWDRTPVAGTLVSGEYSDSELTTLRGLTSIALLGETVTTAFANSDTLAQIATKLQTALNGDAHAGLSGATVTAADNRLTITFSGGEDGAYVTGSNAANWKMTAATNAVITSARPTETFADMANEVAEVDPDWSFVALTATPSGSLSAVEELSAWTQAQDDKMCAVTFNALNASPPANATGATQTRYATFLKESSRSRTIVCHAGTFSYMALSVLALFAAVDYEAAGSHLTLANKVLPSISADNTLTESQLDQLDEDRVNYYTSYGSRTLFQRGVTSDPNVYADERFWLDWFAITVRDEVLALLAGSPTLPLDDFGLTAIRSVVTGICDRGVANGGISRGGTVSEAVRAAIALATGNAGFSGELSAGYMVYIPPVSELSSTLRSARQAPPIRIWILGADAIQRVTFQVDFS